MLLYLNTKLEALQYCIVLEYSVLTGKVAKHPERARFHLIAPRVAERPWRQTLRLTEAMNC